ncbi:purine-cytosine permease family protein [Bacillus sp. FJAT-45037]|uniref:purine-cytosine permease family protein n=1 Tax=Bacillus sp. FJAT-45037 TaxID=2011007 RepID=UPI000C240227|nr:cytosine permease [Bacillus sp. FJAT-45037]
MSVEKEIREPMIERFGLESVPKHLQTTTAKEYAAIQVAISVNAGNVLVPALAVLEGGLTFLQAVLSTVIGAALAFMFVSYLTLPGSKYGIPSQYGIRAILGSKGARYLASPVRTVTSMYWFAVQTIGGTYLVKELIERTFSVNIPFFALAIFLATIMAVLALVGFEAVKKVTRYFLPMLFIGGVVMLWILMTNEVNGRTFGTIVNEPSGASFSVMFFFASLAFVQYVSGVSSASDMARYAKSVRHGFWGLFSGNVLGFLMTAILGAYTAALAGSVNPYVTASQLTNSTISLTIIVIASIASMIMINLSNAYTGGYSLLNSLPQLGRVRSAVVFGCLAILLSTIPALVEQAQVYISFLGALIIPLSAVIVCEFLFIKRKQFNTQDVSNITSGEYFYNRIGIMAALIGMIIYVLIPSNASPGFLAFLVTGTLYTGLAWKNRREVEMSNEEQAS